MTEEPRTGEEWYTLWRGVYFHKENRPIGYDLDVPVSHDWRFLVNELPIGIFKTCFRCGLHIQLVMRSDYGRPTLKWRSYRHGRIPKSCEEVQMEEALG